MRRIWQVARRDYIEVVSSRTFIVLLLTFPVLLIASIAIPRLLEKNTAPAKIVFLNLPSEWEQQLRAAYDADTNAAPVLTMEFAATASSAEAEPRIKQLQSDVRKERCFGYVTVEPKGKGEWELSLTTRTAGSNDGVKWLHRALPRVARSARARGMGLSAEQMAALDMPIELKPFVLPREGDTSKQASDTDRLAAYAPIFFTYLLWVTIFTLVQKLMVATIEEKSNRTVEVILSSMTAFEFICGKVLAGAFEGFTVLLVWLGTLGVAADYFSKKYFHNIDLTVLLAHKDQLVFFCIFFVMGFVLFAALTVGLGALCNSIKDTQNLMTPVMLLMVMPILVMVYVGTNPNSPLSIGLSFFPFFTPFLMMNRIAATPPPHPLEVIGSLLLLGLSIVGTTWAGAKLFRIGILMYGKPPSLREIAKLLRSPHAHHSSA